MNTPIEQSGTTIHIDPKKSWFSGPTVWTIIALVVAAFLYFQNFRDDLNSTLAANNASLSQSIAAQAIAIQQQGRDLTAAISAVNTEIAVIQSSQNAGVQRADERQRQMEAQVDGAVQRIAPLERAVAETAGKMDNFTAQLLAIGQDLRDIGKDVNDLRRERDTEEDKTNGR